MYKQGWISQPEQRNYGRFMKWKELAVNLMLLALTIKRANTFFLIVLQKVLKAVEVSVMTAKGWSQGKHINRKITQLIWLPPLALRF